MRSQYLYNLIKKKNVIYLCDKKSFTLYTIKITNDNENKATHINSNYYELKTKGSPLNL